jgi:Bifunctional DNA primase/polymerase, N-terminal
MSYFQDAHCRETLDAALALASAGFAVFPCIYGQKEPATKRGFYDSTTNAATIRRWFGGNFKRNLAVRTGQASGAWALDEDNVDSLKALTKQYGPLPITRQSRSSRGLHYWFKTTVLPIPTSSGRVGSGLDVKGEGGYIIVPPSIHPDGPAYRWLNNEPIVEAPPWLLVLARKPTPSQQQPPPSPNAPRPSSGPPGAYGLAALRSEIDTLAAMAPQSGRNNQLNRASFSLHQLVAGGELDAGEVERQLVDAATANGLVAEDGMRQTMATIRSGAKAGLLHPRSRPEGRR